MHIVFPSVYSANIFKTGLNGKEKTICLDCLCAYCACRAALHSSNAQQAEQLQMLTITGVHKVPPLQYNSTK